MCSHFRCQRPASTAAPAAPGSGGFSQSSLIVWGGVVRNISVALALRRSPPSIAPAGAELAMWVWQQSAGSRSVAHVPWCVVDLPRRRTQADASTKGAGTQRGNVAAHCLGQGETTRGVGSRLMTKRHRTSARCDVVALQLQWSFPPTRLVQAIATVATAARAHKPQTQAD